MNPSTLSGALFPEAHSQSETEYRVGGSQSLETPKVKMADILNLGGSGAIPLQRSALRCIQSLSPIRVAVSLHHSATPVPGEVQENPSSKGTTPWQCLSLVVGNSGHLQDQLPNWVQRDNNKVC